MSAMLDSPDCPLIWPKRDGLPFVQDSRSDQRRAVTQVKKLAKGYWLMLCYQSANRDEVVFDKPFEFRLDRRPNRQIAFGYGVHVCLGQHLARMEMRILWEELLPRLKSVELNGTPQRSISNFVCGPKYVPICFALN